MAREAYERLRKSPEAVERDPLIVELVFDAPLSRDAVRARLRAALRGVRWRSNAVFHRDGDRFHFVDFPEVDPRGQEAEVFAFARELRVAVDAAEANPVLPDSIEGASHVAGAIPEEFSGVCETPRVDRTPRGWHHALIRTPQAWQLSLGSASLVAVIDTGYSTHLELQNVVRKTGQRNYVEGGTDASDRFSSGFLRNPGHGTLVMSVVASRGSADGIGEAGQPGFITGAAPGAKVLPIRAIQSVIDFTQRNIPAAIMRAVKYEASVIAMALGGPTRVAATEQALRNAVASGTVVVCAAGNCWPAVVFPAAYAPMGICTAVAALQPDLRPWPRTGRGPEVTISAFGEHVWGASKSSAADSDAGIRPSQGTTLATSMTAGVAALWVARHGGRAALLAAARGAGTTVQAMWVHCLTQGLVRPPQWNGADDLGAGVLDAERVLAAALPGGAVVPPPPAPEAEPTINVLVSHLAGQAPAAMAEVTPPLAPFAPEILWLSYRAGARQRMTENGAGFLAGADAPSPDLRAALADKPALRALVGVR